MEFCPQCDNLLVHKILEGVHQMACHGCHFVRPVTDLTVLTDDYLQELTQSYPIHPDIALDSTLPRTAVLSCPNEDCPSRKDPVAHPPEVVLTHANTDYLLGYMCYHCRVFWKNGSKNSES